MITFSESFLNFLRSEADKGHVVPRLITNAYNLYDEYPAYNKILTDDEVDYITMRHDGLISYLPAGKEHKTNERGEWARDGRQSGKAGKVIRKIFTKEALRFIPEKEFEAFGNVYKAKFLDNGFKFEIKPNSEILKIYSMKRADGEAGLNASCMNDDDYFSIYEYCECLQILIMVNKDNRLCGRALVWNVNHERHGNITFMDRIYVSEDYMYDLFLNYARENKWWRKYSYKKYDYKSRWINPATDCAEDIFIKIKTNTAFEVYPYIDTFSYGGDGWLSNNCSGNDYTYSNIDGTRDGDEGSNEYEDDHNGESYDDINDHYINEDDAVFLCSLGEREYRDRTTSVNNAVEAYTSRRNTEWFHEDDNNIVQIEGSWYYKQHDDVVYREDGEYDMETNCVVCETDSGYYESDDDNLFQAENGNYYHKENDDNIIFVQGRNEKEHGEHYYLPDVEDRVIQVESNSNWYWATDKRVKRIDFHLIESCHSIYAMKTELIKHRNRFYHPEDHRLIKKLQLVSTPTKRKAQAS
jgi:hypothetical protein